MTPPRKPAEYSYAGEEEPTRPGNARVDDRGQILQRLYANLTPEERRELVALADDWFRCDANRRALVRAMAHELAG